MYWLIIAIVVALDQLTKWLVVSNMYYGESIPLIKNIFHLTYTLNLGASFSILQGQRGLFIVITIIVLGVCLFLLTKIPRKFSLLRLMLAFFCGGTLGNFLDRLLRETEVNGEIWRGAVVDFFDFRVFPIFNIADCCIVVSLIIVCILLIFTEAGKLLENEKHE